MRPASLCQVGGPFAIVAANTVQNAPPTRHFGVGLLAARLEHARMKVVPDIVFAQMRQLRRQQRIIGNASLE